MTTPSTVADVMSRAVVAVGRDADFREIADTLQRWQVSAVPVLTGDGRVVGVVTRGDLLKVYLEDDRELADRVRFELVATLGPAAAVDTDVRSENGRITLSGDLPDAVSAPVLERLVRSVPGVVGVELRLTAPA
ncbi:CBS-domain-containing membrane protein [Kitasatospora sp. MAA19]|uniref:CBS domain-containing protein n=1 Tax=Kitasatospora sp. MAA19 TaxID=3035090 RepID=UPI002476E7F9|nr:CBS domain-containing protein [Kitasatospora sp. MAA19]MDH6706678.1 CBS-domain-containing membrane protein [Kitasatospora sp. MAA19]